jgi:hypothetical protein
MSLAAHGHAFLQIFNIQEVNSSVMMMSMTLSRSQESHVRGLD